MDDNVVAPKGRLDSLSAPGFLETMNAATGAGGISLLIDFAEVSYISSAGLRVILIAAKAMAAKGGRLALCSLGPQIAEVIELGGVRSLANLSIHPNRDAALS